MTALAFIVLAIMVIEIFDQPFRIGKDRGIMTPRAYVTNLVVFILVAVQSIYIISL